MHALQLTVTPGNGALVRILGLVERRGFTPVRVGMEPSDDGLLALSLEVQSGRPVDLLVRQLTRLFEVLRVEVLK